MSDTKAPRSWHDMYVGLIFIAIALAFGVEASRYDLGSGGRVGPGLFPLGLSIILFGLGIATLLTSRRPANDEDQTPIPWKAIVLVSVSLGIFGYAGNTLGLVPVVFICTFMAALASRRNSIIAALSIAAAMATLCFVIFKVGLGITLPTFGPVFSF